MANTPNLDIVPLVSAQAQKEVSVNSALSILDTFAGVLSIAIANGANTLTEAQCQNGVIVLTGALTAVATVVIPAPLTKVTWVINLTTGGFVVTVQNQGYGGVTVPFNAASVVFPGVTQNSGTRPQTTRLSKSVAGGANVTLTDAEAANQILEFTGAITANIAVIVPAAVEDWIAFNNTTGAFTLTLKVNGQTGVAITQGKRVLLYCDGTDVRAAGAER